MSHHRASGELSVAGEWTDEEPEVGWLPANADMRLGRVLSAHAIAGLSESSGADDAPPLERMRPDIRARVTVRGRPSLRRAAAVFR